MSSCATCTLLWASLTQGATRRRAPRTASHRASKQPVALLDGWGGFFRVYSLPQLVPKGVRGCAVRVPAGLSACEVWPRATNLEAVSYTLVGLRCLAAARMQLVRFCLPESCTRDSVRDNPSCSFASTLSLPPLSSLNDARTRYILYPGLCPTSLGLSCSHCCPS